ncbi:hypothetical protein MLD38_029329 [Melastoma candidum]|uniref:Uncharacterized protein n=1 Tax=Melastoma candidum TaxID=119954 RepID=A0ACB9N593_9MYRT|nr:hypothetical protein MLD38_029329 [Melastoma candidum]
MSDEWEVPQDYFFSPPPHAHSPTIWPFPRDFRPIPEHGWSLERAPSSQPLGLPRLPAPAPPFMLFDPLVSRQRMIVHSFSSPMFPDQFNPRSSVGQPGSRMTTDEQAAILKKLRKDIYNSSPRRFSRMISTYYRNQNSSRARFDARDYDEDSKRCAVCLEDFEYGEEVMITPCDHMFHENCILPWVMEHGQCPVCRFSLHEKGTSQNQAAQAPETVYRHFGAMLFIP